MIPLRDRARSKSIPVITVLLIIVNVYVFFKELFLGPALRAFVYKYAVIPVEYIVPGTWTISSGIGKITTLISALFLHGGWIHLMGNMWYLWIFGDNVEDKLGHLRFLVFYILCGIIANLVHIIANINSNVPALGASGCIAGVLGAYFLLFPRARIVTLLPIFVFWTVAEVPALFFLGIWFLLQFFNGFYLLPAGKEGNLVAWWAHIGGFIAGVLLVSFIKNKK